jgi:hypothetical protein
MRSTSASVRTAFVVLLVLVAGCGLFGGDDEKSITLQVDDEILSVQQGSRDSVMVTLGRTGFDGPVTLAVEGTLPEGVSVSYSPRIIQAGSTTSRVRFIATGAVNPGTFNVTLRATGDGVADKVVDLEVTVTVTGSFTLGTLGTVKVAQGGGDDATILLTRNEGNASSVALSITGLPDGLVGSFTQSPTTERAVTLRLTATVGVAPGTYNLTITGAAAGFPTSPTTQVTVTVIAPPSTVGVSLPFCSASLPVWFAYQNEGFGWQRVTATGNAFNFAATQKVAIAYVLQFGSNLQTTLFFATRTELQALSDRDCDGVKTLTGTIVGLTAGQASVVVMGANAATTTTGNFTLQGVNARPLDIVATRGTLDNQGFLTPDKLIIRRSQDLATTIPALDFTTAEAFSPATSNLTVTGFVSGNVLEYSNNLWSATSTYGAVGSGSVPGGVAPMPSVPGAQLVAGDKHELFVDSYTTSGQVGHSTVAYFTTTGDRTEPLGPLLSTPSISVPAGTPYARLRGQLPMQPEYGSAARFVFLQGTATQKFLVLVGTAGYFGGAPSTWDIVTPDLTGAAAFDNSWMPSMGQSTPFSAEAFAGRGEVLFGAIPDAGETIKLAYRVSTTSTLLRVPATEARSRRAPLLTQYLRR